MEVKAIKTRIFREGDELVSFITSSVKKIPEGSILVVTSKIISLAEGRTVPHTEGAFAKIVKSESDWAVKTSLTWLTEKDGMIIASAGLDESNADGKLVLLPKDAYKSAKILRRELMKKYHMKKLGVVISDSGLLPLRKGVIGLAIGYAGFAGLRSYAGKKDLFKRVLRMTSTNIADSLASAAIVCMGEGAERQPLAIITDAPVVFTNKKTKGELSMPKKDDIFYPLLKRLQ